MSTNYKFYNKKQRKFRKTLTLVASLIFLFTIILNTNHSFASTFGKIPILDNALQVMTYTVYKEIGDKYEMNIDNINLYRKSNSDSFTYINEKYDKRAKQLNEEFQLVLNEFGRENVALTAEYKIKAINPTTMSIELAITETVASSNTRLEYDTIDIKNETFLTLKNLFKNDSYIQIISQEIKNQMKEVENSTYNFYKIDKNQQFYISNDNKLVIVFDKYQIAPGFMGNLEFQIPTEVISNILVNLNYIK